MATDPEVQALGDAITNAETAAAAAETLLDSLAQQNQAQQEEISVLQTKLASGNQIVAADLDPMKIRAQAMADALTARVTADTPATPGPTPTEGGSPS